ncbi:PH and SEC7 domain-containing protein 2-like isoform X3 [Centruroides sculpturatus]|uniref:PH and SEC7 domain-containing protein 2-like isoform X3 n=1 Tax=Centruroides sculpturatus TaxID=218467 RepID=UPI000C6DB92C|nr:PH and SEC7 domain-containing protein 2-like isoform X3 [Centruroides sculpturatus]
MAASNEALRKKSESNEAATDSSSNLNNIQLESNGIKENDENIPPPTCENVSNNVVQNGSNTDNLKSSKSQTRPQQPRVETFVMTGDLIINLNSKTSNLGTKRTDNLPFGQISTPTSPEEIEQRLYGKGVKRESSNYKSPVAEKKGNYSYSTSYVRTSKSEDHLQKASLTTVNIDVEDDIASSLNTLLDTKQDNPANERIVWTYNAPVGEEKSPSPPYSTSPTSPRSISSASSATEYSSKPSSPKDKNFPDTKKLAIPHIYKKYFHQTLNSSERDQCFNNLQYNSSMERISCEENYIDSDESKMGNRQFVICEELVNNNQDNINERLSIKEQHNQTNMQSKQEGVTNIVVDENKIYVQVSPNDTNEDSIPKNIKNEGIDNKMGKKNSQPIWLKRIDNENQKECDGSSPDEDSVHSSSPPMDDESDIESLHSFHYSPKAIDMPSAFRLAKRLFHLEGFKKSDVSRHLCKNNDFSRVVAEEYLKFFDFSSDMLDMALRKFLKKFCLIGETQERERVLVHFSKRYLECNPGVFKSQDAVHTLTCALMLLNTDLHGENVGRKMTCVEFIENLNELNDGENFPKEVLKSLYHSIKSSSIEWATSEDDDDIPPLPDNQAASPDNKGFIGHNPFLENVGRKMTCVEFIENLNELNDGENFPKEVLKSLYHSIKSSSIEWATEDDDDIPPLPDNQAASPDNKGFIGHNPFLETLNFVIPNPNCATEYKKGYVMRKCCIDPNGKRTPLGKRGWKMFYATLRDLVLYLHKDENGFRKNQLYDSLYNSIRIHHALATKASDYTKKQHVFRLQTADQAEYLFQTSDSKELQSWIDTINFVAASLSAPPLACGVGSQKKFQRPLLPVSHTKLNFREQLQDQEDNIARLEKELEEHLSRAPDRGAKSRHVHEFAEKEAYLQYELKRYRTYAFLQRSKLAQYPELEPPLVETSIGEVDEPVEKNERTLPNSYDHPPSILPDLTHEVKRSLSDRFSYRAAIYKNSTGEGCV